MKRRRTEWLSAAAVEGIGGLDGAFESDDAGELDRIRETLGLAAGAPVSLRHAIAYLVDGVQRRHAARRQRKIDADGNPVEHLPQDVVYEKGFAPLQGGFRARDSKPFHVFDQWIENVPTHQIVPVAVEYDPETGLQR